jgi:hypothetical protein
MYSNRWRSTSTRRSAPTSGRMGKRIWGGGSISIWCKGVQASAAGTTQTSHNLQTIRLTAVEQQYLDYETEPAHTRDIYKAVVVNAPAGLNWVVCKLTEERRPDVTELTAHNSIKLSKGFWEIKLQGISSSVFTLQIIRGDEPCNIPKRVPGWADSQIHTSPMPRMR